MPAFLVTLLQNWQAIFGVVQMVETMFGPKPGQGAAKLAAATDFIKTVVPTVAADIASQPSNASHLDNTISSIVKLANDTNTWYTGYKAQQSDGASGA